MAAQGTPEEVRASADPLVHQFVHACPRGRCRFTTPAPRCGAGFGPRARRPCHELLAPGTHLGFAVRCKLADIGTGARGCAAAGPDGCAALDAPRLVRDQVHFLGNYSLSIIAVSGLFVGFVLALQGCYILQRFGSTEALGLLVALSLLRELGPVVTALLFAGRAGTSLTAESA